MSLKFALPLSRTFHISQQSLPPDGPITVKKEIKPEPLSNDKDDDLVSSLTVEEEAEDEADKVLDEVNRLRFIIHTIRCG